ncbi:MAG: hypothetical protein LBC71_08210 [Oscillospiraceae bacterium]|jgi:hypothetical protein|nr:hypothetical protein [Oscillospiraceae bacterium]
MKTIKQVADELGVSKDKIKYQMRKLPTEFTHKVGKITYINDDGVGVLRDKVGNHPSKSPTSPGELPTVLPTPNDRLYDILQDELNSKNKLISDLTAQLDKERQHSLEQSDKLAALAETAQALHAGTIQQQLVDSTEEKNDSADEPVIATESDAPPTFDELRKSNGLYHLRIRGMTDDELTEAIQKNCYDAFKELERRNKAKKRGFFGLFRK